MQSRIHNLIVSSIKRNAQTRMAEAETKTESSIENLSNEVIHQLTTLFRGQGIKVGDFEQGENGPKNFESNLGDFIEFNDEDEANIDDFENFGSEVATLLANRLNAGQAIIAKDGY
ncbi:hypothetical protein, partial [Pseudoalteromonas sp. MMG024]|uniref:hypothetical protein n=1 Tax=Pseudoalteromonas sp. MMG024 TaxID=2909980 RepID=UPI001F2358DE